MPTPINNSGSNHVYGEYMHREKTPAEIAKDNLEKFVKKDALTTVDNLLSTEAGQTAMNMADMKVDNKDVISAAKWNAYVAEKFPHVMANPVQQYIEIVDAMNSITTYTVQEQKMVKSEEKAALEAKSQAEGGDGKAPEMGV